VVRAEGRAGPARPALPGGKMHHALPEAPGILVVHGAGRVRQEFDLKPSTTVQADRARMVGA